MPKFDVQATVIENVSLGGKYYRLRARAAEIAQQAKPGQFCMIRPAFSGDSLLRRPFSIAAVRDNEVIEFAYTAIGRGTRLLSRLKPNDTLLCLGPLGNSFPVSRGPRPFIIAGGIGIAPFPFLNRVMNDNGIFPTTFYGARSQDELIYLEELHQLSDRIVIATDDGTAGFHGFVTDVLEQDLQKAHEDVALYACGPHPMLRRVKQIAEKFDIPAFLSMEEIMGCGVGICIGCPIPLAEPDEEHGYVLCCKDGPIFPSTTIAV